jgi:hypothetical protein
VRDARRGRQGQRGEVGGARPADAPAEIGGYRIEGA